MGRKAITSEHGREILKRIRKTKPFIQASLTITKKRCGNPKCKCMKNAPLYETTLLTWKEGKKTKTIYIPKNLRREVQQWVEEWRKLRKLIVEMSIAQRKFLTDIKKIK